MTYPKSPHTPLSDDEVRQVGDILNTDPSRYDPIIGRLYARLYRTEERLTKAEDGAVEEAHAYNGLLDDYRAEIAKAEALASKVAAVERLRYDDTDDGNQYEHIPGYCGVGCSGCWAENIGRALGETGGTETADLCAVCKHPQEGHSYRHTAGHGYHEWVAPQPDGTDPGEQR